MPSSKVQTVRQNSNGAHNSKFEEIQRKNLEELRKRVELFDDDSDEEDFETDKNQVDALFRNYQGSESDIGRIRQFFESGENCDCLICIRQVKTKDKIWSCLNCFCSFHLLCIQKWANENLIRKRIFYESQPNGYYNNSGVFFPKKKIEISWDCPQCRKNYEPDEIPRYYECFCKRERDPAPQSFLIPHSCGEICNKPLEPLCSHSCLLLCHPGPHPVCAQIIHTSCKCKKSPIKAIRCSQQSWSCDKKCLKTLSCEVHKCEAVCHNECPPCNKKSLKKCACGSQRKEIKCTQTTWKCQQVCKKPFPCGVHFCEKVCHVEGDCGNCPFGFERTCFCGKQAFVAESCEESLIESCGDTCLKPLSCDNSNHRCLLRCHKGDCTACTELIEKKCRCGNLTKEFPCSKELLCETKCKLLKNCKKHNCNKKCCVECSPCDKICSKQLSCGKHKCSALCHAGACYPCTVKQKVKCRCGATTISVLCGRGKKGRSPRCKELCKLPSKCHHDPLSHKCHFGDCSNCIQICGDLLPCSHLCQEKCHDYVKVVTRDENFVPKLPGEVAEEKVEMKKLPHPPCAAKIPVLCIGNHESTMMECHEARRLSCGRNCNRKLNCGNHVCKLPCHSVADPQSDQQDVNCDDCDSPCTFVRPKGCSHKCPLPCHPKACKRCTVQIKAKCFCGLTEVYYRCCDVYKSDANEKPAEDLKRKYLTCGSRCIKNYSCGHQCVSNCHSGPCLGADNCKKKVKITCDCKTRKIDYGCDKVRAENITIIDCDELCEAKKQLAEEERRIELSRKMELEAEKNRRELELYEKKFGKKVYKERKPKIVKAEKTNFNLILSIVSVLILLASCGLYLFFFH